MIWYFMLHSKRADSLAQLDGIREDKIGNAVEKSIILFSVKLKYVNVNTHLFSLSSFFWHIYDIFTELCRNWNASNWQHMKRDFTGFN